MRYWLLTGLAIVAGVVLALLWPRDPIQSTRSDFSDDWRIPGPERLTRYSDQRFAQAQQGLRWDEAPVEAAQATGWRLAGIATDPAPVALIEQTSKKNIVRVVAGETLPDGALLIEILDEQVLIERDGCRQRVRLYPLRPNEVMSGCENMPEDAEPGSEQ